MSKIEEATEKNVSMSNSRLKSKESHLKERASKLKSNQEINKSNNSVLFRSKLRSQRQGNTESTLEYDLFAEIREFMEEEQF